MDVVGAAAEALDGALGIVAGVADLFGLAGADRRRPLGVLRLKDDLGDSLDVTIGGAKLFPDHGPDHPQIARLSGEDQAVEDLAGTLESRRLLALEAGEAALDHAFGDIEGLVDDLGREPFQVL